jgi:hypothetical protein
MLNGVLIHQGSEGNYWTNTQDTTEGYVIGKSLFFIGSLSNPANGSGKEFGFSLRYVQ